MKPFLLVSAAWVMDMVVLSQSGPIGREPALFALSYVCGFVFMALMVRTCPPHWSVRKTVLVVFLLAFTGRVFFWDFPVGNDVYRYIWEGYIQNHGINPYQVAPADPALQGLLKGDMVAIWQRINHKDMSAIYPPLVMLLFRGLAAISPSVGSFKLAMLGCDLMVLVVLVRLIKHGRIRPANLCWYAANPLVLVYVAGEAHIDIVQAVFLLIALYAIVMKKPGLGFLSLGLATVSKYLALAVWPFLMARSNRWAWPAILLPAPCFLPFVRDVPAIFHSLTVFGARMHYNDGLSEIMRVFFGTAGLPILMIFLLGWLSALYLLEHDPLRSAYLAIGSVLLCLPTLHPWYLVLMAPLMVLFPSRAWFYLMLAMVATLPVLVIEYNTGVFQEIKWLKLIVYVPFYGLLLHDTLRRKTLQNKVAFEQPRSISAIVPVLNEERRIEGVIGSLRAEPDIAEIIVVDGGSDDRTRRRARQTGAKVISGVRGRGHQVNAGIAHAHGDVILVLHADTVLLDGSIEHMLKTLKTFPSAPGGAFKMTFEGQTCRLRLVAWLNNVRAAWLGIAFGDQGQFFRREALADIGGFPDMMLMEDVELSMRMKGLARPLFIKPGVRVSARRWERSDFLGNVERVLKLFLRYLLERRVYGFEGIRGDYYGEYYRR